MKTIIGCLILVFVVCASAEPLLEGRVRLDSGDPVANAQVRLFDMSDLRQGAIARAQTDGTGYFALPLATLAGRALPARFALGPNYPNPFNPSTVIPYQLAASSQVRLEVFNLLGQHLATLVDGERPAGFHTAMWHATDAAGRAVGAGVYIYRMTVGAASQTGRMVLIDGQAGVSAGGAASVWSGVFGGGRSDGESGQVYGLIVSGEGLVPYVDSSFRVEAGMTPVELVVAAGPHLAGKATDDDLGGLFDSFNEQQEEEEEETTEEEEETDSTSSAGGPDLIVQSASVNDSILTPGQAFTLQVTVQNQGDTQAAATMLHYYRSNNSTISASDTEVGTGTVDALDASATSEQSIALTASVGVERYYGACVASVGGESNTDNNCSSAVKITVSEQESPEDDDGAEAAESSEDVTEDFLIREPSQALRETFGLTSFYQQWIDVEGYPILGSENVSPYAMKEAAWLIQRLMSHRPDVLQAMVQNNARFTVIAYNEMLTQIPEYSHLRLNFYWDRRARGLGGRASSFGEEHLLNYPGDPYEGGNLLIHEFAHSIHLYGLNTVDPDFDNRLYAAFVEAIATGLWKGTYASTNRQEYWAEGVTAWFNAQFEFADINTRTKLKDYDPELARLLAEVFGDTDWRYTPPATRTHLPHLQGFDPQESPTFEWPRELAACYQQLFEPEGDGGDKWVNLDPHNPSQLSRLRSPSRPTSETEIIFVNKSGSDVTCYWLTADGREEYIYRITSASRSRVLWVRVGQTFLIKDQNGKNLAVFRAEEKTGRAFIGPAQAKLVAMAQDRLGLPDVPQLAQNAPNPFNSQTVLSYFLPTAGPARVEVFALTGQRVATLRQGPQAAGHHRLYWNGLDAEGRPLASGIYLYRLATDFGVLTRKLMLLR